MSHPDPTQDYPPEQEAIDDDKRHGVTSDMVRNWLGNADMNYVISILVEIADGIYTPAQLKQDIESLM